nr:ATP-binding cassette domain-containing protein [Lachnospira multipara]
MIELKNVRKKFGNNEVLKDVSLHVDDGEVVVLLGPSGSGKTTFLRCINFLERADAGRLTFDDNEIDLKKGQEK